MKSFNVLAPVALVLAITSGAVHAGPAAHVTFKNNGKSLATYDMPGSGALNYARVEPAPASRVEIGGSAFFKVTGLVLPDSTTVVVTYRMGGKSCRFNSSYGMGLVGLNRLPKWDKHVEARGGARCDAKITSVNQATGDWWVEFTMR